MEQEARLAYLIKYLAAERGAELSEIPRGGEGRRLLRSLMNVRPPEPVSDEFLRVQDEFLAEERERRGVVDWRALQPEPCGLYLWRGDITRLRAEAIVNAANGAVLGCFVPCHGCIDNAIHSAAGVQLRLECAELMRAQGRDEPPGRAKITRGWNLPARWVIHTVGPIVRGGPDAESRALLASCYRSCLALASERGVGSIAFCCISTGEYGYPNEEAARIAVAEVKKFLAERNSAMKVIFNVFKEIDYDIYKRLLR